MSKRQTVTVSVDIDVRYLKGLIKEGNFKVRNQKQFKEFLQSKEFKDNLSSDLLIVWENDNLDQDTDDLVQALFSNTVEFCWNLQN